AAAVAPPDGTRREGDVYYALLRRAGFYAAEDVRQEMGEPFNSVKQPETPDNVPMPEFVEL
ncbi:MAG TPA: hypothetical protein VER55_09830, partial [Ardenticatenaceae bacterium]|nr:hypothetical protein [Ardenticatenaceae bacterium]